MSKCFLCKIKIDYNKQPIINAYVKKGEHRKSGGKFVYAQICINCLDKNEVDRVVIKKHGYNNIWLKTKKMVKK